MASPRQTIRTDIEVNSDEATAGLKKLGKAADGASVDVEALAKELKQAQAPVKSFGDTTEKAARDTESAFDRTGESAYGASSAIGEAFGGQGDAASAIGSLGEVIEEVAGSFGPIGIAAAVAGGALIAGLQSAFESSKLKAEELKQKTSELFDALVEGKGKIDEAYKDDQLKTFITENLDLARKMEKQIPGSLGLVREALGGNEQAYQQLSKEIEAAKAAINAQRTAQGYLTPELQKQYETLINVENQIDDTNGALHKAKDATNLYTGAINTNTDAWIRNGKQPKTWAVPTRTANLDANGQVISNRDQGRAAGGPVSAGVPYTVGEYGRETFVPSTDGTIVPNGAGVGGSVTVHQTILTNDPIRAAQQTAEALRRAQWRLGR